MRSAIFCLGILATIALTLISTCLFIFGLDSFGWAAAVMALAMSIVAFAGARYDSCEGLAFVEVEGDSWVDPDNPSTWRRAELHASDTGAAGLRVGYVHWFAETESCDFTVGIGHEDAIFVVDNANGLCLKGKREPKEVAHLQHV